MMTADNEATILCSDFGDCARWMSICSSRVVDDDDGSVGTRGVGG